MSINDLKQAINVDTIIGLYSLKELEDDGDEFKFICPWHDETKASCFINKQKKVFHCFGCGSRGSIIDFVMKMEGTSFRQAVDKLSEMFNVDTSIENNLKMGEEETVRWLLHQQVKDINKTAVGPESLDLVAKSMINAYDIPKTDFWKKRMFTDDVIPFFELGLLNDRMIIPIRDIDGSLLGYSTRSTIDEKTDDRFLHQKGFPKGGHLYNFNNVGKLLSDGQCDMIMLVEGFSDVWRAFQHGFLKCVAIMGSEVSDRQIDLLLKHTYRVCLAFDNDDSGAGIEGMKNFWNKTKNLIDIEWMRLPKGLDVGGLNKDEFWEHYNRRVKV